MFSSIALHFFLPSVTCLTYLGTHAFGFILVLIRPFTTSAKDRASDYLSLYPLLTLSNPPSLIWMLSLLCMLKTFVIVPYPLSWKIEVLLNLGMLTFILIFPIVILSSYFSRAGTLPTLMNLTNSYLFLHLSFLFAMKMPHTLPFYLNTFQRCSSGYSSGNLEKKEEVILLLLPSPLTVTLSLSSFFLLISVLKILVKELKKIFIVEIIWEGKKIVDIAIYACE